MHFRVSSTLYLEGCWLQGKIMTRAMKIYKLLGVSLFYVLRGDVVWIFFAHEQSHINKKEKKQKQMITNRKKKM